MNISGLLGTFASSLRFYIDEFERIILHISENLPKVGNQIECHITEARSGEFEEISELLDRMSAVRVPIFEIIIEMQKEDIISQQMNHLHNAVEDVQEIIDENKVLFVDYLEKIDDVVYRDEYRHIFTLISFLLNSIEKQMSRINKELIDFVSVIKNRFSEMESLIGKIHSAELITAKKIKLSKSIQSILNITESLSNELVQYNNFFERLHLLQDDISREVSICSGLRKEVDEDLERFGGMLPLNECRFGSTVIQKIVNKLSVEEERQILREEFSELNIEESSGNNLVLF